MNDELKVEGPDDGSVDRGHGDDGREKEIDIAISYNGIDKPLTVSRDELIGDVRNRAVSLFGIAENQHLLGLFSVAGGELSDAETVKDAKVKNGTKLLLRPSAVRAG